MLVLVWLAMISSLSAQQVAVTSIVAYDVVRKYLAPSITTRTVLRIQRLLIVVFALVRWCAVHLGCAVWLYCLGVHTGLCKQVN